MKRLTIVFIVPVWGVDRVLGEYVRCAACQTKFHPSILLECSHTPQGPQAGETGLRNIVAFTPAAAMEIHRRMAAAGYSHDTYVRVLPKPPTPECDVKFDLPFPDDSDWLGRSQGLSVLVQRDDAEFVRDREIDFDGHGFVAKGSSSASSWPKSN